MTDRQKILLVDDRKENLVALQNVLAEVEAQFVWACSGNEALEKTLEHDFSLILMDVQMPDMDGFETVSILRQDKKNVHIPIIFLSAIYKETTHLIRGVETGGVDFLTKPIIPEILVGKVKILLEHKRFEQALRTAKETAEAANDRIEKDLDIARQVQLGLYPRVLPAMDGLALAAEISSARQVGGDYYDMIQLNDHELAFWVVDVAGHDIASAFVTGMAKISFTAHVPVYSSLVDILNHVNDDMMKVMKSDRFLSAFIAIVNTHTRRLRYAKAGHFSQALYRAEKKELEMLKTRGMLLGSFDDGLFEEKECPLSVGDKILLYTDGLFENMSPEHEQFGETRLKNLVYQCGHKDAPGILNDILHEQQQFCGGRPPNDDVCLIVVELKEKSYATVMRSVLGDVLPTIPPVLLNARKNGLETLSVILKNLDTHNYSDALIRYYQKTIRGLLECFWKSEERTVHSIRVFVSIDEYQVTIAFVLEEKNTSSRTSAGGPVKTAPFFKDGDVAGIIELFNPRFGSLEVNEQGNRCVLAYQKQETTEEEILGTVRFDQRPEGAFMTIPQKVNQSVTLKSIQDDLISEGVINADYEAIGRALKEAAGETVRVGPRFVHYNTSKNVGFTFTCTPLKALLALTSSWTKEIKLNHDDIRYLLLKHKISYGINTHEIDRLVQDPQIGSAYMLAEGEEPVNGSDAVIIEQVTVSSEPVSIYRNDGHIFVSALESLPFVKKGAILCEKKVPQEGKSGMSIFGRVIDPEPGKECELPVTDFTCLSDDGLAVIAAIDGYVIRTANGLGIKNIRLISGDLVGESKKVSYNGHVIVKGCVESLAEVHAHDSACIYGNISDASVYTDSGAVICDGIIDCGRGGELKAGGDISAVAITNSTLYCKGTVRVKKSIENSHINADEQVCVSQGAIVGGVVTCPGSVSCAELGSPDEKETTVCCYKKTPVALKQKIDQACEKIEALQNESAKIKKNLDASVQYIKNGNDTGGETKIKLEDILKDYAHNQRQLHIYKNLREKLELREKDVASYGSICVSRKVYPNVIIKIGSCERVISRELGPVWFVLEDNQINMKPFTAAAR